MLVREAADRGYAVWRMNDQQPRQTGGRTGFANGKPTDWSIESRCWRGALPWLTVQVLVYLSVVACTPPRSEPVANGPLASDLSNDLADTEEVQDAACGEAMIPSEDSQCLVDTANSGENLSCSSVLATYELGDFPPIHRWSRDWVVAIGGLHGDLYDKPDSASPDALVIWTIRPQIGHAPAIDKVAIPGYFLHAQTCRTKDGWFILAEGAEQQSCTGSTGQQIFSRLELYGTGPHLEQLQLRPGPPCLDDVGNSIHGGALSTADGCIFGADGHPMLVDADGVWHPEAWPAGHVGLSAAASQGDLVGVAPDGNLLELATGKVNDRGYCATAGWFASLDPGSKALAWQQKIEPFGDWLAMELMQSEWWAPTTSYAVVTNYLPLKNAPTGVRRIGLDGALLDARALDTEACINEVSGVLLPNGDVVLLLAAYSCLGCNCSQLLRMDAHNNTLWQVGLWPIENGVINVTPSGRIDVVWRETTPDSGPKSVLRTFDPWGHSDCAISGPCFDKAWSDCLDSNPCTADLCDAAHGGCYHVQLPDGATCTAAGGHCALGKCQ